MTRRVATACVVACALAALVAGCGKSRGTFRISSLAMAPTYKVGDKVKVNRDVGAVKLDEVVVVYAPAGANSAFCGVPPAKGSPCPRSPAARADVRFVKRVVAGPGDRVAFANGRVVFNGKLQADPHADTWGCPPSETPRKFELCNLPRPVTVPPGHYFVVGDNRGASSDSRQWGPVPKDWIYGKVTGKS